MKKVKTILFSVAIVLVSLFLCSAGCQNVAGGGSSGGGGQQGGGSSSGGAPGMTEAAIAAIEQLTADSPVLTVKLTDYISRDLKDALKNAPAGKINLDLSQTGITSIDYFEFRDCSSLKSVNIPSSVTSIGYSAFWGCSSLVSVNIPDGVREIGNNMFNGCASLTNVNIPSTVYILDNNAFKDCSSLTSVNIPSSVTYINVNAFDGCTSLRAINVDTDNNAYSSDDGILYNKDKTSLLLCPKYSQKTSVRIPDSVTAIGTQFNSCVLLTSVNIPSSVTNISENAFEGCISLTSLIVEATEPPSLGTTTTRKVGGVLFGDSSMLLSRVKIYVPAESVEAYKTHTREYAAFDDYHVWKYYADQIEAIPNS